MTLSKQVANLSNTNAELLISKSAGEEHWIIKTGLGNDTENSKIKINEIGRKISLLKKRLGQLSNKQTMVLKLK